MKNYKACDIFNAEETGLFYKLMPNKTLQLKGEKCHGGKKSKERLTVLAKSNMDGSEKNQTFGNWKISKPTVFQGRKIFSN